MRDSISLSWFRQGIVLFITFTVIFFHFGHFRDLDFSAWPHTITFGLDVRLKTKFIWHIQSDIVLRLVGGATLQGTFGLVICSSFLYFLLLIKILLREGIRRTVLDGASEWGCNGGWKSKFTMLNEALQSSCPFPRLETFSSPTSFCIVNSVFIFKII